MTQPQLTPMMQQWTLCKEASAGALLLFRMGDFYEAFHEDATVIARELELTLTQRQGIPMSGVPVHTCDLYIDRLIAKGHKVAVAEQMENPKEAKGLVRREVVRIVTPGTIVDSTLVSEKANNYLVSLVDAGSTFGLASLDLSTGEFRVVELKEIKEVQSELHRLYPAELLTSGLFYEKQKDFFKALKVDHTFLLSTIESWHFEYQAAHNILTTHFGVHSLDGFGLEGEKAKVKAAGGLLYYLKDRLSQSIAHIRSISSYQLEELVGLDRTTQRNLELIRSLQDGSTKHTLLSLLDQTRTPMGGRLMRHWICQPLLSVLEIRRRQDGVSILVEWETMRAALVTLFDQVRDLERLMMKVSAGSANPRDLLVLKSSFEKLPDIRNHFHSLPEGILQSQAAEIFDSSSIAQLIGQTLSDNPPLNISDGGVIREGVHAELDELRVIRQNSKKWVQDYQEKLREEVGIKTLKVSYTHVTGYYIEVSRGQSDKMPSHFQRRQTLVNHERYCSPELKSFEEKVLVAEDRIAALELELFISLRKCVALETERALRAAKAIALADCLLSFALVAKEKGYSRPLVDEEDRISIHEGRHPILDSALGALFTPNNTFLDGGKSSLHLITGPNMAGKSTYIRQVALLVLMAQIGSFLPAKSAEIGVVDKIFTRVGASDNLMRGQSTFMVEMTETAHILNQATEKSLIILDEIGRGTSTYDGISIAWAIAEYLLTTSGKRAKTLFATHYFELTKLEEELEGVVNYHAAVNELDGEISFLHKIARGKADRSYGIHVGKLAGLPAPLLKRAEELLQDLESQAAAGKKAEPTIKRRRRVIKPVTKGEQAVQLLLFEP